MNGNALEMANTASAANKVQKPAETLCADFEPKKTPTRPWYGLKRIATAARKKYPAKTMN